MTSKSKSYDTDSWLTYDIFTVFCQKVYRCAAAVYPTSLNNVYVQHSDAFIMIWFHVNILLVEIAGWMMSHTQILHFRLIFKSQNMWQTHKYNSTISQLS